MHNSMLIHPEELSENWIDKLAYAGIKTLGIHPRGGKNAAQSLEELIEQMQTKAYREQIDYAKSKGLEIEYEIHTMGYLLPRQLFNTHPEYFRVNREGQRTSDYNLCVSNQNALDLIAQRAAKLATALYGSSQNFYFWLDDGHDLCCHCPACQKLSASDQQMLVLNAMLKEIKKHIPNARMAYLAYMDSIVPPTSVQAEEGIFLEYAPLEKYTAKGPDAPMLIAREKEMIKPLLAAFSNGPKKVLEYWYDNSMFSGWKKPPKEFRLNEAAMRADISEYRAMGFDTVSTFACFLGEDYEALYNPVDVLPFAKAVCNDAF